MVPPVRSGRRRAELHRALLAYASDFHLLAATTFPHGISYYQPNVLMAS
ncbi:MAG: hypothetical protein IPH90_03215, partial [Thermomonas sp.]|nr:hypothetical protein [Thermomonas sp.]